MHGQLVSAIGSVQARRDVERDNDRALFSRAVENLDRRRDGVARCTRGSRPEESVDKNWSVGDMRRVSFAVFGTLDIFRRNSGVVLRCLSLWGLYWRRLDHSDRKA